MDNILKKFLSLFSFKGNIGRREFGISLIIFYVASIIDGQISNKIGGYRIFSDIVSVLLYWFILAQGAKRCRNLNLSGWWVLVPIFNPFVLLFRYKPYEIKPKSKADFKIAKLQRLHNEGIITKAELEAKKKQALLDEI